jgi:hypothetical protein
LGNQIIPQLHHAESTKEQSNGKHPGGGWYITYIKNVGDAERLEDLGAGGIIVAPEEEEVLDHLCREGGLAPRRGALPLRQLQPVAAHPANLALLVLVEVPADPARVLPLPLPHLEPYPRPSAATQEIGSRGVFEVGRRDRVG